MSREEVVFTKKAIVSVAVISVIASNVLIGAVAVLWLWRFSDALEQKTTAAATAAAVSAVETTIRPMRDDVIRHGTSIEILKDRQDRIENIFIKPSGGRHGNAARDP